MSTEHRHDALLDHAKLPHQALEGLTAASELVMDTQNAAPPSPCSWRRSGASEARTGNRRNPRLCSHQLPPVGRRGQLACFLPSPASVPLSPTPTRLAARAAGIV